MKKIALSILFILINVIVFSQAHTYDACCRYSKGNVKGDCVCPGCKKDNDDEKAALNEEARQIQEKAAVEKAHKEEAIRKADEELAKKRETEKEEKEKNTVFIEAPKVEEPKKQGLQTKPSSGTDASNSKVGKSKLKSTVLWGAYANEYDKSDDHAYYFYSLLNGKNYGGYFLDKNGDTLFLDAKFQRTAGAATGNQRNFPINTGIVALKSEIKPEVSFWEKPYTYDIVNLQGKRLFNDENICFISHISDDYFFVGYNYFYHGLSNDLEFKKAAIYNLKSQELTFMNNLNPNLLLAIDDGKVFSSTEAEESSLYRYWRSQLKPTDSFKSMLVVDNAIDNFYECYFFMKNGTIEIVKINVKH